MLNHTKIVALCCADIRYKIKCNSVHPAAIMTPMWDAMQRNREQRKKIREDIEMGTPMGHFGEPSDLAFQASLVKDARKWLRDPLLAILVTVMGKLKKFVIKT